MPSPSTAETVEQRTLATLEEIARWTRFMGLTAVREVVQKVLTSEEDCSIYYLSTGVSSREIERVLKVSRSTIQARWAKWQALGIVKDSPRWQGRKEAVFTLQELGLEIPEAVARLRAAPTDLTVPEAPAQADQAAPTKSIEEFGDRTESSRPGDST